MFSVVFGKSASRILDNVIALGLSNFDVAPLLDRRCKATIEEVEATLDGKLSYAQSEKLKIICKHMKNLETPKETMEAFIFKLAEQYQPEIALLLTVPGISSPLTAIRILAEIGTDLTVFEATKKLCSWAGVTAQNN